MVIEKLLPNEKILIYRIAKVFAEIGIPFYITGMRTLLMRFPLEIQTRDIDIHVIHQGDYYNFIWNRFNEVFRHLNEDLEDLNLEMVFSKERIAIRGQGCLFELTTHPDIPTEEVLDYCQVVSLRNLSLFVAHPEWIIFGKLLRFDKVKDVTPLTSLLTSYGDQLNYSLLKTIFERHDSLNMARKRFYDLVSKLELKIDIIFKEEMNDR